ncbi:Fe-assimilating 1 [Micractinium conductrix]|uniref:Fe-assimilating 1 n=1 Tax=Micractinium conductrix TaxID=554055 RepID=A0A2P6VHL3_9CHLO|nr:Fe-assimilating 1 [Micractinium conductrix]|eukprot:PSC73557.1 Fe-assimilating 1 [Micractinium conductrix]
MAPSQRVAAACLACLLAAVCCPAVLAADATGTSVMGTHTFGSDVSGYLDMSQDVCDLIAAVDAKDWNSAEAIYKNGQNSLRSDGTTRKLQEWALDGAVDESHWGLYSAYFKNDTAWLDTFIGAGFAGVAPWTDAAARAQVVKKGVQSNLLVAYMFHEVDEAHEELEEGLTDPKTGAPHLVDEAAAIYFGTTCPTGSVADVANKRATSFGTLTTGPDGVCTAATNVAVAKAMAAMQAAAAAGDDAAYEAASKDLEKAIVTIFVQATLTYAAELDELVGAGNDTAAEEAEGVAFFRTIAPLVAQVAADDAETIMTALMVPAKGVQDKVETAFAATLEAYDITAADLGTLGATSSCELATTTAAAASPPPPSAAGRLAGAAVAAAAAAAGAVLLL